MLQQSTCVIRTKYSTDINNQIHLYCKNSSLRNCARRFGLAAMIKHVFTVSTEISRGRY